MCTRFEYTSTVRPCQREYSINSMSLGYSVGSPPMNWMAGIPRPAMERVTLSQSSCVMVRVLAFGPESVQQCEHWSWQRAVSSHSTERMPVAGDGRVSARVGMLIAVPSLGGDRCTAREFGLLGAGPARRVYRPAPLESFRDHRRVGRFRLASVLPEPAVRRGLRAALTRMRRHGAPQHRGHSAVRQSGSGGIQRACASLVGPPLDVRNMSYGAES